jgi:hypothetical protein
MQSSSSHALPILARSFHLILLGLIIPVILGKQH